MTERGGHFGHMLGSELKKMGVVVVLNDISRLLDEVVNEQWSVFQVDLTGKLRNLLWIFLLKQLHSDLAFVLRTDENIKFYLRENTWKLFQTEITGVRVSDMCQTPGSRQEVFSKDSRILP